MDSRAGRQSPLRCCGRKRGTQELKRGNQTGSRQGNEPSFWDVDWDVGEFGDGQIQRAR